MWSLLCGTSSKPWSTTWIRGKMVRRMYFCGGIGTDRVGGRAPVVVGWGDCRIGWGKYRPYRHAGCIGWGEEELLSTRCFLCRASSWSGGRTQRREAKVPRKYPSSIRSTRLLLGITSMMMMVERVAMMRNMGLIRNCVTLQPLLLMLSISHIISVGHASNWEQQYKYHTKTKHANIEEQRILG